MPRRGVVCLDASPDAVRTAARDTLHAREIDGELRVPLDADDDELWSYVAVAVEPAPDGSGSIVRATPYNGLELPFFGWFIGPLVGIGVKRAAKHVPIALRAALAGEAVPPAPAPPSFLPLGAFDSDQANQLATVAAAAAIVGFAGALVGQLNDPVQETFHVSDADLGVLLAVTRFGALISLLVAGFADRQGRRRAILAGLLLSVGASAVSAIAPTFFVFGAAQLVQRAAVIATAVVAGIAAVEDAPEGARAFAAAMLALAGGFGFTFAIATVPLADVAPWAWRLAFAAAGASALFIPRIARNLKESERYARVVEARVARGRATEVFDDTYRRRFLILAAAAFLLNVFAAPSSQFTNKFLDDDRHYSGADIALFRTVTTGLPGLLGLLVAGPLAELKGRRRVMSIGLAIGVGAQMVVYLSTGAWMWTANIASTIAGAAGGIALGTVEVEMFPTEARGTSNGMLIVAGVLGSAVGLLTVGFLADEIGIGDALAWCGIGSLFAAIFLLPLLPESAHRTLDEVSPTETEPLDDG